MGLIVYGNRDIEVTKEADRFIARDKTLEISAEAGSLTEALNALKKGMKNGSLQPAKMIDIRI